MRSHYLIRVSARRCSRAAPRPRACSPRNGGTKAFRVGIGAARGVSAGSV